MGLGRPLCLFHQCLKDPGHLPLLFVIICTGGVDGALSESSSNTNML